MIKKILLFLYRRQRLLIALTGAATAVILILTLLPTDQITKSKLFSYDKIGHALVFGGWTYLFGLVRFSYSNQLTRFWGKDLLAGLLFGLSIEMLQYGLPVNRNADAYDFFADSVGILIALYLLRKTQEVIREESTA